MPPLANEILQHVVEELAQGPREDWLPSVVACSTTNSALLAISQKHIFQSVTLYSHPTDTYDGAATPIRATITVAIKNNCKQTRLFLRTMAENPHLGSYVKDLTYRFNTRSVHKGEFVLRAIRQLPNVERLTVGIYNLRKNASTTGIGVDGETISAVVKLMQGPQLTTLELDSLLGFPLESLRAAPGLKTLVLREIAHGPGEYGLPSEALSFMPKLDSLVCDRSSLEDGVNFCLATQASRASRIILSRVQKIELRLSERDIQEEVHVPFLQQAEQLKEVHLALHRSLHMTQVPGIRVPPLQRLHPSSLKTLAHLSLSIGTCLHNEGQLQGGITILDPYLGLCDTPLTSFVALETLKIKLVFQGSLDVHVASSFGAQWGALCDILTTRGAFPKLRKVGLYVGAMSADGMGGTSFRENRPLANLFAECFSHVVKPQFRDLEVMHSNGVLDFSFVVKVIPGGR